MLKSIGEAGRVTINTNGWTWWTFVGLEGKGKQGRPRTLDELRREYLAREAREVAARRG